MSATTREEKLALVERNALEEAIRLANGKSALARKLTVAEGKPVSRGQVNNWLNRKPHRVPLDHVLFVEQVTGVSRKRLRARDWRVYWPAPKPQPAAKPATKRRGESASHAAAAEQSRPIFMYGDVDARERRAPKPASSDKPNAQRERR